MTTMNAALFRAYGPPSNVRVQPVARPTPKPDEVLVRVHSSCVSTGDARIRGWDIPSPIFSFLARPMFGITKPRKQVLGTVAAGTIESVGANVTNFKSGDRVLGTDEHTMGAHAEFISLRSSGVITKLPDHVTFDHAATLPFGAGAAVYFLTQLGNLEPSQRVLINGASGALGTAAVQYAKHLGAHVTAVCSAPNHELARSLGADECVDYNAQPLRSLTTDIDKRFHLVFDCAGHTHLKEVSHLMTKGAVFLPAVMRGRELRQLLTTRFLGTRRVKSGVAFTSRETLETLVDLAAKGALRPVVDSTYTLDQIAQAHQRADEPHKRGVVLLRIAHEGQGECPPMESHSER